MSDSIVRHLVVKDLRLMRIPILCYWAGGFLSIAVAVFGGETLGLMAFILFVSTLGATGIHAIMATVVEERRAHTLAFVMSLPVTIRQYSLAKLMANMLMFVGVWVTLSIASFIVFLGDDGMPDGTIPFAVILLLAILAAFTMMLSISLVSESIGWAITGSVIFNLGTQLFLWWVADLYPIRSTIGGPEPVWNATAVGIIGGQLATVGLIIGGTYLAQARKRDFV